MRLEVSLTHLHDPPDIRRDDLVPHVPASAARLDEAAEAQAGEVRRDAGLVTPDVADDLARRPRPVEQVAQDADPRRIGETVEEASDDLVMRPTRARWNRPNGSRSSLAVMSAARAYAVVEPVMVATSNSMV